MGLTAELASHRSLPARRCLGPPKDAPRAENVGLGYRRPEADWEPFTAQPFRGEGSAFHDETRASSRVTHWMPYRTPPRTSANRRGLSIRSLSSFATTGSPRVVEDATERLLNSPSQKLGVRF